MDSKLLCVLLFPNKHVLPRDYLDIETFHLQNALVHIQCIATMHPPGIK